MSKQSKIFLSADWRKLAIANYVIDPSILHKYLPCKTEIDFWNGLCYVSLVGFRFVNTIVKGMKIPFHVNFEEINLRFYVCYQSANKEWKRGVVFIKEIVPKPILAFVANTLYKENYQAMQTRYSWINNHDSLSVEYKWKQRKWNSFLVKAEKTSKEISNGSEEEFITEHYWGYTKINNSQTYEYAVEHPKWQIYKVNTFDIDVDFARVYGKEFGFLNDLIPASVFLAEGSPVIVRDATKL